MGRKDELLRELMARHNVAITDSIAVGDSEGDIAMLELVENPIAFNPTKGLLQVAKNNAWDIIIERKNVVYKLRASDGQYYLN